MSSYCLLAVGQISAVPLVSINGTGNGRSQILTLLSVDVRNQ